MCCSGEVLGQASTCSMDFVAIEWISLRWRWNLWGGDRCRVELSG